MKAPEGATGEEDEDDNTDTSHSLGAENMDTLPESRTDSEADLSAKKSPDGGATGSEKPDLGESSSEQPSKDVSPSSTSMMLMNHMDTVESMANTVESMANEIMGPALMNSMLFDSSTNSLNSEIDGELPLYHL